MSGRPQGVTPEFLAAIAARLGDDRPLRRALPGWGRVYVERRLPFLVVYRRRSARTRADEGTDRLVTGEASYLLASGSRVRRPDVHAVLRAVAGTLEPVFGAFLVIEIWTGAAVEGGARPRFRVAVRRREAGITSVERLDRALHRVTMYRRRADVDVVPGARVAPPGMSPLLSSRDAAELRCRLVGIEVSPVYQDAATGREFPQVRRTLQRQLARALHETMFDFARNQTTHRPRSFHSLGRHVMGKTVLRIDRALADIACGYEFLLWVTPSNTEAAWRSFVRSRCERAPDFAYRPLPFDPSDVKRRLYDVPVERVEDPTLAFLFGEQRRDVDRRLEMLGDRNTTRFLPLSMAAYGVVEESLRTPADAILARVPVQRRESRHRLVKAAAFAERAAAEVAYYRALAPHVDVRVEQRPDVASLMVSSGNLLVGSRVEVPPERVEALVQHEIGTHVVTWVNGRAQPLAQLAVGLAGYEALQEGLGVFAEFLVGGLSAARLRLLAARVVAADMVAHGSSFVETFRELVRTYGFSKRGAFLVAMRVHRSGGFLKDAIYLRGLVTVLDYFRAGGRWESLYVGKIATDHVPVVEELLRRRILVPPLLRPRYMDDPAAVVRLERARAGLTVMDVVESGLE